MYSYASWTQTPIAIHERLTTTAGTRFFTGLAHPASKLANLLTTTPTCCRKHPTSIISGGHQERLGRRTPMRHTVHRSTGSFSVSFVAIRFCPEVEYPATIFVIVEFSRSRCTARTLSSLVAPQGPLAPQIALDQERAY